MNWIRQLILLVFIASPFCLIYASFEAKLLSIREVEITSGFLTEVLPGSKVAHISDLAIAKKERLLRSAGRQDQLVLADCYFHNR